MQYYTRFLFRFIGFLVPFLIGTVEAAIVHNSTFVTDQGRVTLIAGSAGFDSLQKPFLGLHFEMKAGWKIYWRSPGDAGFPPQIRWDESQNIKVLKTLWPIPKRFSVLGLSTLGYEEEVVLPIAVSVLNKKRPVLIRANLSYLTCNQVCIPYETELHLDLESQEGFNSTGGQLIGRYLKRVPSPETREDLSIISVKSTGPPNEVKLKIEVRAEGGFNKPDLFVEGPEGYVFEPAKWQSLKAANGGLFTVGYRDLIKTSQKNRPLPGEKIRLTLINGETAIEHNIAVESAAGNDQIEETYFQSFKEIFFILGLAILGGLILNLMPCVLTVLSLKALSLVQNVSSDLKVIRQNFLITASGIVFSFFILATILAGLKLTGEQVGWGMQFQQPIFLSFMAIVVLVFGANLWGLFDINLPNGLSTFLGQYSQGSFWDKHFWTGVFATLLATPCSAPFLGTAVGFALGGNILQIYGIFIAIGFGFSLPYLLFAAIPVSIKFLPRPGIWMVRLKKILGICLFGTSLWFVSIIGDQLGDRAMIGVLFGLFLGILGLLISRKYSRAGASLLIVGILSIMFTPFVLQDREHKNSIKSAIVWKKLAQNKIPDFVKLGKVVFVDVTAEWCVTCKANKFLTLETNEIVRQLNSTGVIAMQGDWTKADPSISTFLKKFNRSGIPFNVVFGPAAPKGIVLSEILVSASVTRALREAGLK